MSSETEIGKSLATLREQAKLKQSELAKKLQWSAAVLSRVESGERSTSDDELDIILRGIDTPEALGAKDILKRTWRILPAPALADPDADLLWEAEQAAQNVHRLGGKAGREAVLRASACPLRGRAVSRSGAGKGQALSTLPSLAPSRWGNQPRFAARRVSKFQAIRECPRRYWKPARAALRSARCIFAGVRNTA